GRDAASHRCEASAPDEEDRHPGERLARSSRRRTRVGRSSARPCHRIGGAGRVRARAAGRPVATRAGQCGARPAHRVGLRAHARAHGRPRRGEHPRVPRRQAAPRSGAVSRTLRIQSDAETLQADLYGDLPTVRAAILVHGQQWDASGWRDLAPRFVARGVATLALNLRGYDGSTGTTNEFTPRDPWTPVIDLRAAK